MRDVEKRLAQRQHDALFKAPEGCLAEVEHDREHVVAGNYRQYRCRLCSWVGRVSGRAVAAAKARGAE